MSISFHSWLIEAQMKFRMTSDVRSIAIAAVLLCAVGFAAVPAATPQYQIYDIGVVDVGDTASQGFGVSHAGVAVGRSLHTGGSEAFTWTLEGGIVGLPNLAGRSYAVSNSANDTGQRRGDCSDHSLWLRPVTGDLAKRRGFAAALASRRDAR